MSILDKIIDLETTALCNNDKPKKLFIGEDDYKQLRKELNPMLLYEAIDVRGKNTILGLEIIIKPDSACMSVI
jgi:hypothetical protein